MVSLFLAHYYVVAREFFVIASTVFWVDADWHKSKEYNTDDLVSRYGSALSFTLIQSVFFHPFY